VRVWARLPESRRRSMIAGWDTLRQRWWGWLIFGTGVGALLVLAWISQTFEVHRGAES
jgi:hypothetical protein